MQWFAANWTRNNWFASNWFAGQLAEDGAGQSAGGWFGYPLDGKRARDEEREEELVALRDVASVAKPATPSRPLTPSEIAAAKGWIDGIHKAPIPIVLPSLQGGGFAFPADQRLSEDEAIALVLLLSEA